MLPPVDVSQQLTYFSPSLVQSMSNLIKKRKRLTDVEVRYYLQQLVKALQYLHSNLVIHRDLKLGNLFIDSQMRLKVGDFGLATRLSDPLERKKTFCGTPNYIGNHFSSRFIVIFIFCSYLF
jgi:serine/threonine protein kinase